MATRRAQHQKLALRADSGLNVGQYYPLASTRTIMGRNLEADVPVDDTKVSRQHAAIDQRNGFYMLADLGSTNGTYLNGRRVEQACFLNAGDRVRLGSTSFIVELREKARQGVQKSWREPTMILQGALNERAAAAKVATGAAPAKATKTRKAAAHVAAPSAGVVSSSDIDGEALAKLQKKVHKARTKKPVSMDDAVHVSSRFANPNAKARPALASEAPTAHKAGVNFSRAVKPEAAFEKFFVSVAELDIPNRVRRLGDLSETQVVYGRWIAAAACVGLTVAAIATRL